MDISQALNGKPALSCKVWATKTWEVYSQKGFGGKPGILAPGDYNSTDDMGISSSGILSVKLH